MHDHNVNCTGEDRRAVVLWCSWTGAQTSLNHQPIVLRAWVTSVGRKIFFARNAGLAYSPARQLRAALSQRKQHLLIQGTPHLHSRLNFLIDMGVDYSGGGCAFQN